MTTRRTWIRRVAIAVGVLVLADLVLAFAVFRDLVPEPLPPMEPVAGTGGLSAELCRACHPTIYDEWASSGHARSFVDPLYTADLPHHRVTFPCERCHTPLVEQRPTRVLGLAMAWPRILPVEIANPRFDPILQREGVTCVACHQQDGHIVGPTGASDSPHPQRAADLRDPDLCARCHQLDLDIVGKLDRPVLDTVAEWREHVGSGGTEKCVDCHMPALDERPAARNGPVRAAADHRLPGPFDAAFVAGRIRVESVELEADARGARSKLVVVNGSGHRVPTAEPERRIVVRLAAIASDGTVIASQTHEIARPIDVPKLRATGEDTTLAVGESRPVELALGGPLAAVARVELTVDFLLWNPDDPVIATLLPTQPAKHRLLERSIDVTP